ncbi:MAG TPA: hypothetical protein VFZ53_19835, partial [Polyangiaceae bacterium]
FGGRVVWGDSFRRGGIAPALSACGVESACLDDDRELALCELACKVSPNPSGCRSACRGVACEDSPPHGHFGVVDPVGAALQQGVGHEVGGYPNFRGWPHWNSYTHQQEYYRWLRRAFEGGLRLMVMLAVSNELLCEYLGHDHPCDDMTNVRLQFEAARELERHIDWEQDCDGDNGNGWYRIASSPAHAREIIASGGMAVVLGAEVDTLFNCTKNRPCSVETVRRMAEEYRKLGLTHVFPVHLFDNAFGGTAAANDLFNLGGVIVNNDLLHVRDCSEEGYEFHFNGASKHVNELITAITSRFGVPYPRYADYKAHCNDRGLEPDVGRAAILAMMEQGMIIDVDHMSTWTRRDVFSVLEACRYPGVVSGHSGFTAVLRGHEKSEGQLTNCEVDRLLKLRGLLAPILSQGGTESVEAYPRGQGKDIADDCGDSAKSFAQAYLFAVDAARNYSWPGGVVGVGFGSDINGLAGMPAPRFGPFACGGDGKPQTDPKVVYDIEVFRGKDKKLRKMQAGTRIFDINYDGFANMGMFPDFVAELRAIGVSDEDLAPLFLSAEAYIQLWERTDAAKVNVACSPVPPPECGDQRLQ